MRQDEEKPKFPYVERDVSWMHFEEIFAGIMRELKKENIFVIKDTNLSADQQSFITSLYRNKLNGSTNPLFLNGSRSLDGQADENIYLAIRLLRKDAEMEIDSDLRTGVLQKISKGVKSRKKGEPIHFVYDEQMPKDLLKRLLARLNVDKNDTRVAGGRYHNFKDLMKFPDCGRKDLKYPPWQTIFKPELNGMESLLALIRKKDRSLHYPYHSFDTFIRVLREAVISKEVKSIKMTLYRLADKKDKKNALLPIESLRNIYVSLKALSAEQRIKQFKLKPDRANVIAPAPEIFLKIAS